MTLDCGVIGAGNMGRNHIRVYSELKGVGELLVYDADLDAARREAEKTGAGFASTFEALVDSVDAVSVCVPTPFHAAVAGRVLEAGLHVLIEKPVCATVAEAEALLDAIPRGVTVGVGHIERFNPIVDEIARIVDKPLYVEMKRHNPLSSRVTASSVVEDLMIHDIDIVAHRLFRGTAPVSCSGNVHVCGALFTYGTTPVYLSASRKASKKVRSIYIEEEERTVEGDFMSQEVFVHRKPDRYSQEAERYVQENIIEKVMVNKVEPLKVELSTFLSCAAAGRPFPVTPAQAVENLRICESIREACRR